MFFFVLFSNIFLRVFRGYFKGTFSWILEHNIETVFINFNFDFWVLAQKCVKPCVNGVLKIQFFFHNLSSKIPAAVRVRTSKYPYIDICDYVSHVTCHMSHIRFQVSGAKCYVSGVRCQVYYIYVYSFYVINFFSGRVVEIFIRGCFIKGAYSV